MKETLSPTVRLVAVAAATGLLCGGLVGALWPAVPGTILSGGERVLATVILGLGCGGVGLVLGLASFLRQPEPPPMQARWAAALSCGLVGPVALGVLGALSPEGEAGVGAGAVIAVIVGLAALVPLLRSRFAAGALLLLVGAALVFLEGSAEAAPPVEAEGPEVWVLSLDTVRADHLDFSGLPGDKAHTPHLSALAAEALVFTQAFSTSALTGPAHASLWSGQGPEEHGVLVNGQHVGAEVPWLPELLSEAGWRTQALVSAAVLDRELGFARGFHDFDSTFQDRLQRGHPALGFLAHEARAGTAHARAGTETVALVGDLPGSGPRLVWVHLYDAHWPYAPSPEAAARLGLDDASPMDDAVLRRRPDPVARELDPELVARGKLLYRAGLEDLDARVGEVLAQVPEDAVLVVVGDHGESLDERDYHFSHGRLPHAADTQVPLLLRIPGVAPGRVHTPASVADLAPTVLRALGLDIPAAMSGVPLQELPADHRVRTVTPVALPGLLATRAGDGPGKVAGVAVREVGHTWLWTRFEGHQAFHREADPGELQPLEGDLAEAVRDELDALVARAGGGREVVVEAEAVEALRALGYLEDTPESGPRASIRPAAP